MVKVLHLITSLGAGGAERQLLNLCQDPDPRVTYRVVSLKEGGALLPLFQDAGVLLGTLGMQSGWPSLRGFVKLCKILKTYKPDVLQTWLYHGDLLGLMAGKVMGFPRLYWNIRCSNMDFSQYSWKTRVVAQLNAKLSKIPEGIVFNAHAGKAAHEQEGFSPRRWIYRPNGFKIPPQEKVLFEAHKAAKVAARAALGLPEEALVLGMVARVDPMKDYQTLFTAVARLQKHFASLHLVVIGQGTEALGSFFAGDRTHLHCLGFRKEAASLMGAFDACILSSAFGEGFPNVMGEAMARGLPVFASDVGDARHLIGEEKHLFPPGDATCLETLLRDFLSMPASKRAQKGQEFYHRLQASYSLEKMWNSYRELYREQKPL